MTAPINIEEGLRRLEALIKRGTLAHQAGKYDVAAECIREAKALVKKIDPDIELPEIN